MMDYNPLNILNKQTNNWGEKGKLLLTVEWNLINVEGIRKLENYHLENNKIISEKIT